VAVTVLLVVIIAAVVVVRAMRKPKGTFGQTVSFANPMYDTAAVGRPEGGGLEPVGAQATGGYADVPVLQGANSSNTTGYMDITANSNVSQNTGYMDVAPNPNDGFDGFDEDAADC